MGNQESAFDNPDDDHSMRQPPSYAGSSTDPRYRYTMPPQPYMGSSADSSYRHTQHQPPSHSGTSTDSSNRHTLHQASSFAGSARDNGYQPKQLSTFIPDSFNSLDQVINALREAGLESSNLIVGIDFTKSNEWTGRFSFNRRSLHAIGGKPNPYEQAISIIGRTLSPFDEDNLIPCFGFGDASTHDQHVFSFYSNHRPCLGFEEVLGRYREILPFLNLSGPTSFAPIIDAAIDIVERSNGQYHVLVIIADGQVTRSPDTPPGRFSPQEQATVNSIVTASQYPLSIILVGVGDGPWDAMKQFDDNIPQRAFDNFQFVNFTQIMTENKEDSKKEAAFALAALMEIPFQYRATLRLQSENREVVGGPHTRPLPPPREVIEHDDALRSVPPTRNLERAETTAPVEQVCPICLTNSKDMAFGCGHTVCASKSSLEIVPKTLDMSYNRCVYVRTGKSACGSALVSKTEPEVDQFYW